MPGGCKAPKKYGVRLELLSENDGKEMSKAIKPKKVHNFTSEFGGRPGLERTRERTSWQQESMGNCGGRNGEGRPRQGVYID